MAKKVTQLAKKTNENKKLMEHNKKEALDKKKAIAANLKKRKDAKKIKVKALVGNLAGKYNLPYGKGQEFDIDENQAKELIKNEDASLVKDASGSGDDNK
jgi:hypothetical protein